MSGSHAPEDDLKRVAERYQMLVEHLTNVFYAHTPDHVLTYMSPQTRDLLGCEPEEALVRWTELVTDHPRNRRGIELTQRAIETGEPQEPYELELRRSDGETVWVAVHEAPVVRDGETVAIVGALTDITARHRMQELLRTELALSVSLSTARTPNDVANRVLQAALTIGEVSAGGFYLVDAASGDLRLLTHRGLSDEFVESVRSVPAADVRAGEVWASDEGGFEHWDSECEQEGLRVVGAFPVRHEDRLLATLNVASRTVDRFSSSVFDALETIASQAGPVLSRVRAEASLQQSEATLRGLFRAAPAGIGLVQNREFIWVNEHLTRMTGYTEDELRGRSARMLYLAEEEFDRVGREKYATIHETGSGSVETRWQRKDGSTFDVYLSSSALDPDDLDTGVVFTAWDITQRKRDEEERRQLEVKIQHAQKLESLGVLAGGIAHDFNNILHAIQGNAELAARGLPSGSRAHAQLGEVQRSVDRASSLCSQMLAYSGKGAIALESVHVGEVFRDIAAMLDVSISKKARLEIEVEQDLPLIDADPSQVRQIAMNLITNASEALMDAQGEIRARIRRCELDAAEIAARFAGENLKPGRYVCLVVEDTGCGMSRETRRRIFEPFYTTKFTGRGLGMAAVLGIVRGHGGTIDVESHEGEGSRVTVLLPAADAAEAAKPPAATGDAEAAVGTGTVLFVDDESALRLLGHAILEEAGYSVLLARNGREALERYEAHREGIAAIVLDLTMPEMDGEEAFHAIRELSSTVPILLCSGYSESELRGRFSGEGPSAYLLKPFTAAQLTESLAAAIAAAN